MDEQEYLEQRLDDQINWYDKKSKYNQQMYKRLILVEIILSVSIPFLTSYATDKNPEIKIVIGVMGIGIALIAGIMNLYKFNENWINYRKTSEVLKQEKFLFLSKSGVYDDDKSTNIAYNSLVTRVESIISTENSNWEKKRPKKKEE